MFPPATPPRKRSSLKVCQAFFPNVTAEGYSPRDCRA
uniref:Uncharacterized protein n=1 Tax=Anguilla anguilla TaxID=7936 RepID=A0A0E9STY4_ANGAN